MAGVELYSPCPCGSGQKFKWCCHKVEAFADKARRLFDGGQIDLAIKVLDEGLKKEPGNPWLSNRKAMMLIEQEQYEAAKATTRQVLQKNPKHLGALILLTRCVLISEGPVNGAGMFQQVLSSIEEVNRPQVALLARVVATLLAQAHLIPAAIKHFELCATLSDPPRSSAQDIGMLESNPSISTWLKDRWELAASPEHLDPAARQRFDEALSWASKGLWASAAAAFDLLSASEQGGEADYNLGICRLWLGDEAGAVGPLRRRSKRLGQSVEAVDLEILAQLIAPTHPDDRVERIQLLWPLRNREALLASLRSQVDLFEEGTTPFNPDDPESPEVESFGFLDRAVSQNELTEGLTPDDIPRILGRVAVGQEMVALETYDDGRVDSLGDRFTAVAGSAIAPAHPRTKVLDEASKADVAMTWEWLYPTNITRGEANRLELEQRVRTLRDVWPTTKFAYLGFRTPERAAQDGDAEVPLRAALCQFELDREPEKAGLDFTALRSRLNVPPEPAIDPSTVDLTRLRLGRWNAIPVELLDDDRLVKLYRRAREVMLSSVVHTAAQAMISRPALFQEGKIDTVSVYSDLAGMASAQEGFAAALSLIEQGRQADPPARKVANAPLWDMIEIRLRSRFEDPEDWVPELAIVIDRYAGNPAATPAIMMSLVELGLIELSPNPDNPADFLVDSRRLQAVLTRYGPRVTTASGRLGVSASKPEVWTPGSQAGGSSSGGIWTPGSGSAQTPSGDKPKLILPGR